MLAILRYGRYEVLKTGVHGAVLGLAALCAAYNFSAWLARRQRHSWVNASLYGALVAWEYVHVRHHVEGQRLASGCADERRAA